MFASLPPMLLNYSFTGAELCVLNTSPQSSAVLSHSQHQAAAHVLCTKPSCPGVTEGLDTQKGTDLHCQKPISPNNLFFPSLSVGVGGQNY